MATASVAPSLGAAGRLEPEAAGARLSELFDRHGTTVLGLCRLLLRHREEAEDAVQQTFLAAYRSLLNGVEPRHPAAWLATIARNECRSRAQQRMREPLAEWEQQSTQLDPVAAAAARADLAELWRAIGALPRRQRQVLLLREFSGLSYGELATALVVSEPAVESLLFRARQELRLRLRRTGSVAASAPLAAIREALARAIGMPDAVTGGALAKVAGASLVTKLVTGAAAVVVASGTVAAVEEGVHGGPAPARAESRGVPAQPAPQLASRPVAVVVASHPVALRPRAHVVGRSTRVSIVRPPTASVRPQATPAPPPPPVAPSEATAQPEEPSPASPAETSPSSPAPAVPAPVSEPASAPAAGGDQPVSDGGTSETSSSGSEQTDNSGPGSADDGSASGSGDASIEGSGGSGDSGSGHDGGGDGGGGDDGSSDGGSGGSGGGDG